MAKKAAKLNMSAPWQIYRNKIAALFEGDKEIVVGTIDKNYNLEIVVTNKTKAEILEWYIPETVNFGKVILDIKVTVKEFESEDEKIAYLLKDTRNFIGLKKTGKKKIGSIKPFACFIPEVVQFFADDISDPESKFNGLMADIAKEVLPEAKKYVYFSTATKRIAAPVHLGCITL